MAQIKAEESPLNKIFGVDFSFSVPAYQRPYSWQGENAAELLGDLQDALDRSRSGSRDHESAYFLGSIVLIKAPGQPDADIVDGQQRIVTLTILFAVLRDLIGGQEGAALQSRIHEPPDPITGQGGAYKVTVRQRDSEFFRTKIQASGSTTVLSDPGNLDEPQRNMLANAVFFRRNCRGKTGGGSLSWRSSHC